MRSWISAIVSLVVMMVVERSGSPVRLPSSSLGPRHTSHSPANANGSPSGRVM